ncbi:hypothetical protein [Streptomyces sp. NPDC051016]|uniref:hypothetical protein n=1 Tax=Streptomyces sp. NPDC051016 TaxID=3365638 RepID=UPI0037A11888
MSEPISFSRPFVLQRDQDISGVSGTGIVADGVLFPDGHAAIHWRGKWALTTPHPDGLDSIIDIHDHGGRGDLHIIWSDHDRVRKQVQAAVIKAFDVPATFAGREAESTYYRDELEQRLGGASTEWKRGFKVIEGLGSAPLPVEVSGYLGQFTDAVMPLLHELMDQRDSRLNAVGRAYRLAYRWQGAHGSANFLVRAAATELLDELGDSGPAAEKVVHSEGTAQASGLAGVDDMAAAECSAQHHGFPGDHRECIRAAQHRGDHIDEHGFHWSDTVAVYLVDASQAPPVESEVTGLTPRQRGFKAVDEYIATLGYISLTTRTQIWRAVNRALEAAGHPAVPATECRLPHEMEA